MLIMNKFHTEPTFPTHSIIWISKLIRFSRFDYNIAASGIRIYSTLFIDYYNRTSAENKGLSIQDFYSCDIC